MRDAGATLVVALSRRGRAPTRGAPTTLPFRWGRHRRRAVPLQRCRSAGGGTVVAPCPYNVAVPLGAAPSSRRAPTTLPFRWGRHRRRAVPLQRCRSAGGGTVVAPCPYNVAVPRKRHRRRAVPCRGNPCGCPVPSEAIRRGNPCGCPVRLPEQRRAAEFSVKPQNSAWISGIRLHAPRRTHCPNPDNPWCRSSPHSTSPAHGVCSRDPGRRGANVSWEG